MLKNSKTMLLIAPMFFDYYKEIIKKAEQLNVKTDYISDAPSNSNLSKAIGRIDKRLIKKSSEKYFYNQVLPKIKGKKYDYLLLVAGMTFAFTTQIMEKIREVLPTTQFIIYQWDSEKNLPYLPSIKNFFDKKYTFDRFDAIDDKSYTFMPLFYTDEYSQLAKQEVANYKYDCSYIGTAHPQKYYDINSMSKQLFKIYPNQFIYHYMPSKLKYYYHKIKNVEFECVKKSDFKWQKISKDEIIEIFKRSKCILDAPQKGQQGLTIRTIECLGAKRKLITTNKDIKNYDFYREENILIYDEKKGIDFNSSFFKCEYNELPSEIYEKYSIGNWLKTILSLKGNFL